MDFVPVQTPTAFYDSRFGESDVKVDEIIVRAVKTAGLKALNLERNRNKSGINREIFRQANGENMVEIATISYN
jgi:hypothetical protein